MGKNPGLNFVDMYNIGTPICNITGDFLDLPLSNFGEPLSNFIEHLSNFGEHLTYTDDK